jgi:hypothetical protein
MDSNKINIIDDDRDWNTYDAFTSYDYGDWDIYDLSKSDDGSLDDYEIYQFEDEHVDRDESSIHMEEPGEIPEDEEAMMLEYYAFIHEQEQDERIPDEDGKMI